MSKTVDVLLVGGAWHGVAVNVPLPVSSIIKDISGGEYLSVVYTDTENRHYRVGVANATSSDIAEAIVDFDHKPAWDLRPPYGNYVAPPPSGGEGHVED